MKKYLILIVGVIVLMSTCSTKSIMVKEDTKQPNFLFILLDDQPFDAVGFHGRFPFLKTPNMDRLTKEGVHFENYFVTQSICSPTSTLQNLVKILLYKN